MKLYRRGRLRQRSNICELSVDGVAEWWGSTRSGGCGGWARAALHNKHRACFLSLYTRPKQDTMPSSDADAAVEFPAFFFSHGSTMMLGEPSAPAAYWEQVGRLAIEQGVERIVMMVCSSHGRKLDESFADACGRVRTGTLRGIISRSPPTQSHRNSPLHGEHPALCRAQFSKTHTRCDTTGSTRRNTSTSTPITMLTLHSTSCASSRTLASMHGPVPSLRSSTTRFSSVSTLQACLVVHRRMLKLSSHSQVDVPTGKEPSTRHHQLQRAL